MTKDQFRDNMGLLGLDTVYFLADRIFSILDENGDGRVVVLIHILD
jgi:1-phosphatidylinositol-4-phosphate 5-kinase